MKKAVSRPISFAVVLILTFTLVMVVPLSASAAVGDTFVVSGITYKVLTESGSTGTVQVGNGSRAAINTGTYGAFTIPHTVTYGGRAYAVTAIGDSAFAYCESLTSVTIPDSVTCIGDWAFMNCWGLMSVIIGNSVTSIGEQAFRYCTSLISVTIPDSVTSIGEWAFMSCWGLTSVTISDSVTSINRSAFAACESLASVYFNGNAPIMGDEVFSGAATGATAYVWSDAKGFPAEGQNWNGLTVRYRPNLASLSVGKAATLVSGRNAVVPITLTGSGLTSKLLVFSIVNAEGEAVYASNPFDASDSFSENLSLNKTELSLPDGDYTFRASITGTDVMAEIPLIIAPNLAAYWEMNVLKSSYNGSDALEIRFPDVGYERQFLGEVFVNSVKYATVIAGNSVFVPGATLLGELSIKVTGIKYPALFPSYKFTFTQTVTL